MEGRAKKTKGKREHGSSPYQQFLDLPMILAMQ